MLYGLIALAIVSGAVAAGSVLVSALLIVPPSAARLVVHSVRSQMLVSAALGCLSGWLGLYASYYWRLASGGSVVLAAVLVFCVVLLLARRDALFAPRTWTGRHAIRSAA
jgi:ABC-type Mn2+/Zn2+ transport system permease subunit